MSKMPIEMKKCKTPEFRASYANVFEPKAFEGQEAKYSLVMLFDKKADLKKMRECANNAAAEKWGNDKTKWPKNLRMPFRDGNERSDSEGYAGKLFVSASSKQRPGVIMIDPTGNKIQLNKEDGAFYSGCFGKATVIAFAYDVSGNRGVSFALCNLLKTRDGDPFSGRKSAEDEFDGDDMEGVENDADTDTEEDDAGF